LFKFYLYFVAFCCISLEWHQCCVGDVLFWNVLWLRVILILRMCDRSRMLLLSLCYSDIILELSWVKLSWVELSCWRVSDWWVFDGFCWYCVEIMLDLNWCCVDAVWFLCRWYFGRSEVELTLFDIFWCLLVFVGVCWCYVRVILILHWCNPNVMYLLCICYVDIFLIFFWYCGRVMLVGCSRMQCNVGDIFVIY
jgi:hypothetical protein